MSERVTEFIAPSLTEAGFELVDVELKAGLLRITVDRPGGVDLDAISEASKLVSDDLDRLGDDVIPGKYVLEVSSPGVERSLRTPDHFRRFVGAPVTVKTRPGTEGERRIEGTLDAADDDGVVVAGRTIPYADIERARTRFVWPEPTPKKATPKKANPKKAGARQ